MPQPVDPEPVVETDPGFPNMATVAIAYSLLKKMHPEHRFDLFHRWCVWCGGDKPCNCHKDE